MAVLNSGGTTPETRDELIMCVAAGRSSSKHSTNRGVGIGSSKQVFWSRFEYYISNMLFRNWLRCIKDSVSVRIIMNR